MLNGKRILLIIGGGIAAFKSLDLIRRLRERGASVTPVLTQAGAEFVTPLSVSALAGTKVYRDLFDLTDEAEMGHIQLSRSADLVLVAPATADLMAKMAQGLANDLASTLLLATDTPVMIAPAMNVRMWDHPATQRNLETLRGDGIAVIGPNDGDMACGEFGPGRMAEPLEIVAALEGALGGGRWRANGFWSPRGRRTSQLIPCAISPIARPVHRARRWGRRWPHWGPKWSLSPAPRMCPRLRACRWSAYRQLNRCLRQCRPRCLAMWQSLPQRWPTGVSRQPRTAS